MNFANPVQISACTLSDSSFPRTCSKNLITRPPCNNKCKSVHTKRTKPGTWCTLMLALAKKLPLCTMSTSNMTWSTYSLSTQEKPWSQEWYWTAKALLMPMMARSWLVVSWMAFCMFLQRWGIFVGIGLWAESLSCIRCIVSHTNGGKFGSWNHDVKRIRTGYQKYLPNNLHWHHSWDLGTISGAFLQMSNICGGKQGNIPDKLASMCSSLSHQLVQLPSHVCTSCGLHHLEHSRNLCLPGLFILEINVPGPAGGTVRDDQWIQGQTTCIWDQKWIPTVYISILSRGPAQIASTWLARMALRSGALELTISKP